MLELRPLRYPHHLHHLAILPFHGLHPYNLGAIIVIQFLLSSRQAHLRQMERLLLKRHQRCTTLPQSQYRGSNRFPRSIIHPSTISSKHSLYRFLIATIPRHTPTGIPLCGCRHNRMAPPFLRLRSKCFFDCLHCLLYFLTSFFVFTYSSAHLPHHPSHHLHALLSSTVLTTIPRHQ